MTDGYRVVLIIGNLGRGGTERQVVLLATGLHRSGNAVRVLCLGELGELADELIGLGVDVVAAGFEGFGSRVAPIRTVLALRRIFRMIAEFDADVVQCFLFWSDLIGIPLARLARVPVVIGSRRSLMDVYGLPDAGPVKRMILKPWQAGANRLADAIVCNSVSVRDDALRNQRVAARKLRIVQNGVPLPEQPTAASAESRTVLAVANLHRYKGHETLLRAFASIAGQCEEGAFQLELAGDGPEQKRLGNLARSLGIAERVAFRGAVSDISRLLRDCAFTVLPSSSEGMPNAVLESLAHARAVVASDVGGAREILSHGGGVLVPAGDEHALAAVMLRLFRDPDVANFLGAQGRRVVEERYRVADMVSGMLSVYRELLSKRLGQGLSA